MLSKSSFLCIPIALTATLALIATCAVGKTTSTESQKTQPAVAVEQSQQIPSQVAANTTKALFSLLKNDKTLYEKNPESFYQKVESILNPAVAFDSIARGVMGKYAHRVSPVQLNNFTQTFRHSLLVYYSKVLRNYDTGNLHITEISPPYKEQMDAYSSGRALSVPVNMTISSGSQTYQLSYSMMKDNGQWKIRNIIIEGINLGIQFRNQFADAVNKKNQSPEEVIKDWSKIMQNNSTPAPHRTKG